MKHFVYILECADKTLYVGCTNNLEKRLKQHNESKGGAHYTKIRRPVILKYSEEFKTLSEARVREAELKRLPRNKKLALIKNMRKSFEIKYFKALSEDEEQIKNLLKVCGGDGSNFSIDRFIVAKDKDKIIGCIRIKELGKRCLELSSLVVSEEYRNRGIGSGLVKEILEEEKKRPIYLLTFSNKGNFYQRSGFKIIKPELLPIDFKKEYSRVINLPFAKNIQVIAMKISISEAQIKRLSRERKLTLVENVQDT